MCVLVPSRFLFELFFPQLDIIDIQEQNDEIANLIQTYCIY